MSRHQYDVLTRPVNTTSWVFFRFLIDTISDISYPENPVDLSARFVAGSNTTSLELGRGPLVIGVWVSVCFFRGISGKVAGENDIRDDHLEGGSAYATF